MTLNFVAGVTAKDIREELQQKRDYIEDMARDILLYKQAEQHMRNKIGPEITEYNDLLRFAVIQGILPQDDAYNLNRTLMQNVN